MKELKQKEKEVEGDLSAGNRHCAWVPEYGSCCFCQHICSVRLEVEIPIQDFSYM